MFRLRRTSVLIPFFSMCFVVGAAAQSSADNSPATREDIEKYLEVSHANTMAQQMMQAVSKPMHQMVHEQFEKDKDKLPPDFEDRMNRVMDEMLQSMPFDEMMKAMEPAYQRHFTHGDIRALTEFYATSTGQKILKEMPAIMAEAMQDMMPIMQKYMATVQERMKAEFAEAASKSTDKQ